jgi:putative hemolysin
MSLNQVRTDPATAGILSWVAEFPGWAAKLAPVERMRDLYQRIQQLPDGSCLENLLAEMCVRLRVDAADQARIPTHGPVVVVANHPCGILDGALLTVLLTRVRPDVKVLTNSLLSDVPEVQRHCIFVDALLTDRSLDSNRRAVHHALSWLHQGGMLAMFPAGEPLHWQTPQAQITDPQWNDAAVRFIRRSRAWALPVYFSGHRNVGFQLLGMIHPKLRSAFLLQEFLRQEGKTIEVRVGSAIPADALAAMTSDRGAIEYLRWRTYLLARRSKHATPRLRALRSRFAFAKHEPLVEATPPHLLAQEIARLPAGRCLAQNGDLAVYLGTANEMPQLLREVGRLREATFRRVGEGTGNSLDLDRFDAYYWHLLLWNKATRELVGAYRAGDTPQILAQYGVSGLYTSTLFRYDERIFQKLGPALELGRSFVRPDYQRQYTPLLLLWKGIAGLIALRPEIPVLFGAVSISNDYSKASREIIYRFFHSRMQDDELAGMIEPRRPFRPPRLWRWDCRSMCHALRDLDELSQPITDVEADGKGLPILLRQYARIGGRLVGFNVDRKFSSVLDGLMVVDLRQTDPAVLERYMGREAAARFHQLHAPAR